jgi:hypothetical protein
MTKRFHSNFRARRGYVLLVTLALLVLSSTLLVAAGQAATRHALEARLEQSQLQRRWGIVSCRSAILSSCEQILVSREQQEGRAVAEFRTTVQLGDNRFTLIVADEQAKANVNMMIDQFGVQNAEDHILAAMSGSGLLNDVRLRPSVFADDSPAPAGPPQLIDGPGQIFDSVDPQALINSRYGSSPPMQNLTCWGNGTLNILRAGQESMRLSLTPALTQLEIARLIAARDRIMALPITSNLGSRAAPAANRDAVGPLLAEAQIDAGKRNRLPLAGRSACHSLWIIAADPQREWYSLTVSEENGKGQPILHSVVW